MDTQPQPIDPQPPVVEPRHPFNEVSVLFPLLSLVTVGYLAMLLAEFCLPNVLRVPVAMMPVYIGLLGAYAADKEIRRWFGAPEPARKGSVFVYLWVLLFTGMVTINFFRADYPLPPDLTKVVIQVLGVFFGSRASKYIYDRRPGTAADPAEQSGRRGRILEIIETRGQVTRAEITTEFGVSKSTAGNLLDDMVREGLIIMVGEGRGTYYISAKKSTKSN
jgi:hypothetical protein